MEIKEEELKAILEKVDAAVAEKIKGFVETEKFEGTQKELDELKEVVEALDVKELTEKLDSLKELDEKYAEKEVIEKSITDLKEELQKQIDEAGVEMTKLAENAKAPGSGKTIKDIITEGLENEDIKSYLEGGGVGKSKSIELDIKAIVDVTGFIGDVITPGRVGPEVSFLGPKKFDIRQAIATGSSDVDSIDHIQEQGFVDATGFLAENAASAESDVNLEQVKTNSTRIATHINVSKRSLRNVSFLQSHLSNRYSELIADKVTDSTLNGDGTSNTFDGFFNNAATFSAGSLANSVDDANIADLLAAAIARLAETTNLQATAIFINPLDEFLLTVTKDLQGSYAENTVIVSRISGRLHINGVPVWSTFHVTQDKYLVCDLSATSTELLEVEGLTMMIADQHATNAIENQVTFIFEMEAILPIYKTFAFLEGTISTDRVAISV